MGSTQQLSLQAGMVYIINMIFKWGEEGEELKFIFSRQYSKHWKVSVCLPLNVNKATVDELPLNKLSVELNVKRNFRLMTEKKRWILF